MRNEFLPLKKIKIGYQMQAKKPIYLLANGAIECGNFRYAGRYKRKFKEKFELIKTLVDNKKGDAEIDISEYRYWNAIDIYDDYVLVKWVKSISVRQIEKFAVQTKIFLMLEEVRAEFKRALGLKWRRVFKKLGPQNPKTPKKAWQLL